MDVSVEFASAESDRESPPFWLTPAAYWQPAHFPVSAWHTHAPFAAWLIDLLRPQTVVELGSHFGFSSFTFAEAAQRLRLPTTVHALDSWEGDDHAGHYGQEVFDYVQEVAAADYPDSLRLVRGWFTQSRPLFADASVDLLHIDGRHAYEDVVADYTEWRSAVRDGGVILFHDIAERENGFGVWRLWEEIAEPGRSFAFEHGHGLGVLAVGDTSGSPLLPLLTADAATAARIRADFLRLGQDVGRRARLATLPAEIDTLKADLRAGAQREKAKDAALAAERAQVAALKASTSWRVTAPLRAVGRLRPRRR